MTAIFKIPYANYFQMILEIAYDFVIKIYIVMYDVSMTSIM